ncbi:lactase-phlorizin hydrolase [Folsomia candida]|uniref:beta-glucosidase n=1 Tax=Folsomia candida TaxID=158441 RepID=A0A226DKN4_FOLCA|nr:lactase-phlorizin hydrolase [Folsomia candida]OXA45237.1 Lactase-phlorizin hydrolase [Folsomia candida]
MQKFATFLLFLAVWTSGHGQDTPFLNGTFPPGFLWGVATSSYQIEGGWDQDGKGPNVWDTWTHDSTCSNVQDCSNGDVACDSYNRIMQDIAILKEMNVDFYRFSIAWSRIIPNGGIDEPVNPAGIRYYRHLINALLGNGIKPFVTMFHWDTPQAIEDAGGWPTEATAQAFARYARVLYAELGDLVKDWITFNEPWVICVLGYGTGVNAPGRTEMAETVYQCGHTIIKAHGLAYRIYETEFKDQQQGQVGITLNTDWNEPDVDDAEHRDASDRGLRFSFGWFAHPLYFGEYPPIMRELVDQKSINEGRNSSRLPSFDLLWTEIINGTLDFIGLNTYTTQLVRPVNGDGNPGLFGDSNVAGRQDPAWESSAASWLKVVPWGLNKLVRWIYAEYNQPPIYVTENGFADPQNATVNDPRRVNYYQQYINELMKATLDGVDVKAYTAWSLMDNMEWSAGYTQRFGIHHVNFSDPSLTRVPKMSAICLTQIFSDNGFPNGPPCNIN